MALSTVRYTHLLKDHLLITELSKICLSLHRNKKQMHKASQYDWISLDNCDKNNQYMIILRNKLDTLQETSERHTLNDEYENCYYTYRSSSWCIPTKPRAKCTILWESIAVRGGGGKASLLNKRNKKYQSAETSSSERTNQSILKEQLEYIQGQINKIRNLVEDRQSQLVWRTVNGVKGRVPWEQDKAASKKKERERLQQQNVFKNLLGNIPQTYRKKIIAS